MDKIEKEVPIEILLVEDNPGDVRLTIEAIKESQVNNNVHIVGDGVEALKFLRKEDEYSSKPDLDLVLLDLNLPRLNGRKVLEVIKMDEDLKKTPVIIFTTSSDEKDIIETYNLRANCYITKPVGFDQFIDVIKAIENLWFHIVKLPSRE